MEFNSRYAKPGHEMERLGMDEWFGGRAAADQRPASFNASSKPPSMTTMGLGFHPSLATASTLDPSLMAVECWRMEMPEQSSCRGMLANDTFLDNVDSKVLRGQPFLPGLSNSLVQVQGHYPQPTCQDMTSGYQEIPTWSTTTSATISLPNSSSGDSHTHLIPFQNPNPWRMSTENISPPEVFSAFVNSNQAMMVPSASSSYTASRAQSLSSATEYHSPISQADISPMEGFSSPFAFGTSGANNMPFNPIYMAAISATATNFQHLDSPVQDEEPNLSWTEIKATPASSFLPPAAGVPGHTQLHAKPRIKPVTPSDTSAGPLSQIHFKTPPGFPSPRETPPRIDNLIVKFETNPGKPQVKGKRKAFDTAGRTKVKKVRENGACFACRAKKVACTEDGICIRCLRAVKQDQQLACHVCLRNKFKDIYIGVKDIHGSLLSRKAQLNDILASLTGPPRQVVVWVGSGPNAPKLQLQVMQCQASTTWATCRWKCLKKESGIYITNHFIEGQRYVIMPSSVPSIDRLDLFGRKILSFSDGTHSGNITPLLDHLLLHYCRPYRPSRLRDLANETLRIASLNGLVAYGFINLHDGSYDLLSRPPSQNQRYVSETIHDQIRLKAAEGFETAEKHIFHEIDNLRDIIGSDDHNRIVVGVCLLRLIVLYRERMVRDEIRLVLPRHGKRRTGHQARLEKAAIMYKRLTVVYSTLCSGSDSPMTMTWQSESRVESGEHETLTIAFTRVQLAYQEFCGEKLTQQHDDVFKQLIVEPARRISGKREKARGGKR